MRPLHPAVKWFGNGCLIVGTIALLSPVVSAKALFPWVVHFIGNSIWMYDSKQTKNTPFFCVGLFFCSWNVLLIASRVYGLEVFSIFQPLLTVLEKLP